MFMNGIGGASYIQKRHENPLDDDLFTYLCFNENYGALKVEATGDRLIVDFISVSNPEEVLDKIVILKK